MLHYVLFEGHVQIHAVELALHMAALAVRHPAPDAVRVFHLYRVPEALTTNRARRIVVPGAPADGFRFVRDALVQASVSRWIKDVGIDVLALRVVPPRMWWIGLHTSSAKKEWECQFGFFWRGYRATDQTVSVCPFCVQLALQAHFREPVVLFHQHVVAAVDM